MDHCRVSLPWRTAVEDCCGGLPWRTAMKHCHGALLTAVSMVLMHIKVDLNNTNK